MHQWFLVSWNDVNVRRDDIDRNLIVHVWSAGNALKIVLKHPKSKKICFNVNNAHLKMGCVLYGRFIRGSGISGLTQFIHSFSKQCTALLVYKLHNMFCFSCEMVHCLVKCPT